MPEYKIRYPHDDRKQWAYENACDCIIFGIGMVGWKSCGLDFIQRKLIWSAACRDVGNLNMV